MIALALALLGGLGVFYLYTAFAYGWTGAAPGPDGARLGPARQRSAQQWLVQAGLEDVSMAQFALTSAALFALGAVVSFAVFGDHQPDDGDGVVVGERVEAGHRCDRRRNRTDERDDEK